jgi:hypothetical protein
MIEVVAREPFARNVSGRLEDDIAYWRDSGGFRRPRPDI